MHRSFSVIFDYLQLSSVFFGKCSEIFGTFFGNVCHKCQYVLLMLLMKKKITWSLGETKLIFKCWKIFHEWAQRMSEIVFTHFSLCGNVIYCIFYSLRKCVMMNLANYHPSGYCSYYFIVQTPNIAFWINSSILQPSVSCKKTLACWF